MHTFYLEGEKKKKQRKKGKNRKREARRNAWPPDVDVQDLAVYVRTFDY